MAETGAWMPMYWADYFGDTLHLTTEEHGAYLLLIGAYWRRGGPLPDDDKLLKNITKLSRFQWKNHRETLAEFFEISRGVWKHKRVQKEIDSSCLRIARARKGGKAKAANRKVPPTTTVTETGRKREAVAKNADPTPDLPSTPENLKRGTRLSLESLPDDWRAFCQAERPDLDPERTWAIFQDHWRGKAGKDGVKLDWLATWRNWVRREGKGNGTHRQASGSGGRATKDERAKAALVRGLAALLPESSR